MGLLAAALAVVGAGPAAAQESPRFSHAQHEKSVPACTSCHTMSASNRWTAPAPVASGKQGHEPCSSCHEHQNMFRPPFPPKQVRLAFCGTCHASGGTDFSRAKYPPYRSKGSDAAASDFWLASFDHARHLQLQGGDKGCEGCHKTDGRSIRPPRHDGCASSGCHGGPAKPAMSACAGCHVPRAGQAVVALASRTWDDYRVKYSFSHAQHAAVSKQDACARCHGNTAVAAGQTVPLPPMIACESCHDGKQAFAALGTRCRSCHLLRDPVLGTPRTGLDSGTRVSYGHARHAAQGVSPPCQTCHASTADGRVSHPVARDHQPCAGCHQHQAEYRTAGSTLCLTCHEHSDPFRKNPLHATFRASEEFVVALAHSSHGTLACSTCHADQAGVARAPVAGHTTPSHAACASCHEKQHAPAMAACAGCHVAPVPLAAQAERWRVRDKFAHTTHRTDVRTRGALDCAACHQDVRSAARGQAIPRPTMLGCADCHQGTLAFKTTGTQCASCHGPVLAAAGG